MARSTSGRRAAAALLAAATSGCLSGHLLDAARRWEAPQAIEQASVAGDRLVVRYRVLVTDDADEPRGARTVRAAVRLASLRSPPPPACLEVEREDDAGPLGGTPVTIARKGSPAPAPALEVASRDGRPVLLVLRTDESTYAPLPASALSRSWTAPWAYPLLPAALAIDAVGVPVLLLFAPAVILPGD